MSQDEIKMLQGRIEELENQLKEMRAARRSVQVSAEEMQAYLKVRDTLAWDPDNTCGINECARCIVWRCYSSCRLCRACDVECACGPCNVWSAGGVPSGIRRFAGFGE